MNNHIKLAENFLLNSIRNGQLANSYDVKKRRYVKPYPEATGYLLSYFSEYYENIPSEIISAAEYLGKIQSDKGSYSSFSNKRYLYTFDTAQIIHSFASLYKRTGEKKYLHIAKKCTDSVLEMQIENGAMFPIYDTKINAKYVNKNAGWANSFSYIQVKNIEGFLLMYELTNDISYKNAAIKLREYGKKYCDLTFTHPGAYCLEGLYAAGERDFIYEKLKKEIIPRLNSNGFLPYFEECSYAYVSGSVQMAILLYKVGFIDKAYLILKWARKVQSNHTSGGLFQYANSDATLNTEIHREINTWGTKYYAELERIFSKI